MAKKFKTNEDVVKDVQASKGVYEEEKGGSQPVGSRPKVNLSSPEQEQSTPEQSAPVNTDLTKTYMIIDVYQGANPMAVNEETYTVRVAGIQGKDNLQKELAVLPKEEVGFKKRIVAAVVQEALPSAPKGENVTGTPMPENNQEE